MSLGFLEREPDTLATSSLIMALRAYSISLNGHDIRLQGVFGSAVYWISLFAYLSLLAYLSKHACLYLFNNLVYILFLLSFSCGELLPSFYKLSLHPS